MAGNPDAAWPDRPPEHAKPSPTAVRRQGATDEQDVAARLASATRRAAHAVATSQTLLHQLPRSSLSEQEQIDQESHSSQQAHLRQHEQALIDAETRGY